MVRPRAFAHAAPSAGRAQHAHPIGAEPVNPSLKTQPWAPPSHRLAALGQSLPRAQGLSHTVNLFCTTVYPWGPEPILFEKEEKSTALHSSPAPGSGALDSDVGFALY